MKGLFAALTIAVAATLAVSAPSDAAAARLDGCGKLLDRRFEVPGLGAEGPSCRRARSLLRGWLAKSISPAGEGLPRSVRRGHWRCRRRIAWACVPNGRRPVRIVFTFDLRKHGDLRAAVAAVSTIGPAGEAFVDYRVAVRNLGSDAVAGKLAATLPTGVNFLSTTVSQGRCGKPDVDRRIECALGSVGTGFEHGALVTIRSAYDCAALGPVGQGTVTVSSPSGDVNRSNDSVTVDELDPVCPDPPPEPDPEPPPDPDPGMLGLDSANAEP